LPQLHEARNAGMPLDLDWVARVQANTSAIERRAATLPGRRTVKKAYQAAWLARAITLIDLTTLAGDDTEGRVRRLCAKARQPVRADHPRRARLEGDHHGRGLRLSRDGARRRRGAGRLRHPRRGRLHRVSGGLSPYHLRVKEIEESVKAGAREIDIVISRRHVLTGNWQALYDEMRTSAPPVAMRM
jgi:deoxyribose-phosphate aldolase